MSFNSPRRAPLAPVFFAAVPPKDRHGSSHKDCPSPANAGAAIDGSAMAEAGHALQTSAGLRCGCEFFIAFLGMLMQSNFPSTMAANFRQLSNIP
ncbi:MAG: hypothetical protein LBP99_07525 [Azoarcus sp.]|nr:hypothetical protein [Azoarcus sp.]